MIDVKSYMDLKEEMEEMTEETRLERLKRMMKESDFEEVDKSIVVEDVEEDEEE